ncbi:transglutaminase family protein [Bradyrhizobium jicamae]|uniref:transglutaminase family protein n=1 Tax=Bradyrhizobium jicamae TaxID=280332 RepID=UPI001BAC0A26|nr:transglutaminase family protein [Bradyrhizobium jicamae]MBR0753430.1 transglutaminase family protein [Bradyrhizobium jicamae]
MALHVALTHETRYRYDRRIKMGPQVIRLRPAPHCRTPILSYSQTLEPKDHFVNWQQDPFGNFLARIVIPEPTDSFAVTIDVVADMAVINPFNFFVEDSVKGWPFDYGDEQRRDLAAYLEIEPPGPLLQRYIASIERKPQNTIDFLIGVNQRLQSDISYLVRMEPGVQTPEQTLQLASGSCRDSGWLLVQLLRHFGFATRFVSGYLIQLTPDVKSLDGPTGTDVDFTDLHAWTEVYVPGAGWIGLDPTSGLLAGEGHIPLAATPHPTSAAPISGGHDKAEVDFSFRMEVKRIRETPRVTKPYTEEIWSDILAAGHAVDERLVAGDVRLTMGGEPTFVAADDMEGAEWNTAAVGPNKRRYADDLVRRLERRFAPGALLHYGQGKWYPGEQLPRWAFALYWRSDGQPLWEDKSLLVRETAATAATSTDAERFMAGLCNQLGLPETSGIPAYEDAAHFMLVEQKLPINETPATNTLEDTAERERIISVFDRGLGNPVSYVLPIQAWQTADRGRRWVTERWGLRRSKLFLVPGDSPAGFRLPLGSLPSLPAASFPHVLPRDPFAGAPPLPERRILMQRRRTVALEMPFIPTSSQNEVAGSVRTALAIEPRNGQLCIFMPPLSDAEDYAALVAAIEETARVTALPVLIEGYTPPSDPRINSVKVTPDPGVIEVNIHPSRSWDETVTITTALYEEAHLSRLSAEKFMLDGRHTGTGGGNHIVLGGHTPADSPFLRRPDLLGSIIAYWQNHPSLSYLFSGLFIGPTSQAPRLDEGRHEALYEMEIALDALPRPGSNQYVPPWLVDRILRNLLVDVTGNTHRAEICIDKLFSPDGPTGRLGLVEFRSFEMPPHARMSLAQQLLIRALVVMFWERPYRQELVHWGTSLHDRFMLPKFVWSDFGSVITDLKEAGLPVELSWFEPHFEFRFPRCGVVHAGDIELEIRQALEPWHVLGEEGVIGGTARYVDSSLERVEVKVRGMTGSRYVVTCNGRLLPLTPTGTQGEAVAGVRYRAWWPPSALHPTVPPHVPLTFDVVDTWSQRSIAGCRYHVSHPGGRNFEIFPVNAYEAEGRRLTRFEPYGHTAGPMSPRSAPINPQYPLTLDLRRMN